MQPHQKVHWTGRALDRGSVLKCHVSSRAGVCPKTGALPSLGAPVPDLQDSGIGVGWVVGPSGAPGRRQFCRGRAPASGGIHTAPHEARGTSHHHHWGEGQVRTMGSAVSSSAQGVASVGLRHASTVPAEAVGIGVGGPTPLGSRPLSCLLVQPPCLRPMSCGMCPCAVLHHAPAPHPQHPRPCSLLPAPLASGSATL